MRDIAALKAVRRSIGWHRLLFEVMVLGIIAFLQIFLR